MNYHEQLLHIIDEYQNPADRKKLRKNPLALRMSMLFDPGYTLLQQARQEQAAKAREGKAEQTKGEKAEPKADQRNKTEEGSAFEPSSPNGGKGSGEQSVVMLPEQNVAF